MLNSGKDYINTYPVSRSQVTPGWYYSIFEPGLDQGYYLQC
jgi:hypothetical protein